MRLLVEYLENYEKSWGELGYKHADDSGFDRSHDSIPFTDCTVVSTIPSNRFTYSGSPGETSRTVFNAPFSVLT